MKYYKFTIFVFKNSSWKYFNIILQEKSLLLIHYIIIILILDKKNLFSESSWTIFSFRYNN